MNPTDASADAARQGQEEKDLLADGRDLVERLCASTRFRYLYPDGPSLAPLLAAYQEFDRLRTIGRLRGGRWRRARRFRKLVRAHLRADVRARSHRLSFGYPLPRLRRLPVPPQIVRSAILRVDPDARPVVEAHVGMESMRMGMTLSVDSALPNAGAAARGLEQFREALLNEALASPASIRGLHTQHLHVLATAQPTVRRHPLATLLLVKIPLQLLLSLVVALVVGYFGAFIFFNDARLGAFVSTQVSGLLEGDLDMRSIHWSPRLIFDLVTGVPTPVVVEDVTVWSPYKSTAHGREHRAAHAERLHATLVLHEIIPWNRLGVPTVLEIPWVLHFPEVRSQEPLWFDIEEYDDLKADGTPVRYLSLVDAFALHEPRPVTGDKGLSFAVDDGQLGPTEVDVDYSATSQWRALAALDEAAFSLRFDAPPPELEGPIELPFAFQVRGSGDAGVLQIDAVEVPLDDIVLEDLTSNTTQVPAGDLSYRMQARAAGSRIDVTGTLQDMFARLNDRAPPVPPRVDLAATTADADGIIRHLMPELDLPQRTVVGRDSPAAATVTGALADPVYTLESSRLSLDFLEEPAWVADDVEVALTLQTEGVPSQWRDYFDTADSRSVVSLQRFRGVALDGSFKLSEPIANANDGPDDDADALRGAHIVMPLFPEDPYLIAVPLQVAGVNPAQLVPTDPELQQTLGGVATGRVDLRQLVLGPDPDAPPAEVGAPAPPSGLRFAEARFSDLRVRRDRGPAQDGLPREVEVSGRATIDAVGNLDLRWLNLSTGGASLAASGGLDTERSRLEALALDLRIDDGAAFARAFGIPKYFDRLRARTVADGRLARPSATGGALTVDSLTIGDFIRSDTTTKASFVMIDGHLKLRLDTTDAHLFGGKGPATAEVELFDGNSLSADPKLKASASLTGVDLALLSSGRLEGRANVELEVDDGRGRAARLDDLRVQGEATVPALHFGGTTYRNATIAFSLNSDEVAIERLVLPIHRPVSPHFSPDATLATGSIVAEGTLSLDSDPTLDLVVDATRVPVSLVSRLLEFDAPFYGQVGAGTTLAVRGTLSRPRVDGRVVLQSLSASGVALGSGALDITSDDYAPQGPLAGHRELRVHGELRHGDRKKPMQWSLDAVVALGAAAAGKPTPVEAQLDVEFDRVTIATLLRDPVDPSRSPPVEGQLEEASARVLTCSEGRPMLSDCIGVTPPEGQDLAVSVEFAIENAWLRSNTQPLEAGMRPCDSPTTLCSDGALAAKVDWPSVELSQPWRLKTGGTGAAALTLAGSFDLSDAPAAPAPVAAVAKACSPPPLRAASPPSATTSGRGDARVQGTIDLQPLAAIARSYGVGDMEGRLDVDLSMRGRAFAPQITGHAALSPAARPGTVVPLNLELDALPFPVDIQALELHLADGWVVGEGEAVLRGGTVMFGSRAGTNTGYAFGGDCANSFAAGADGRLSANLIESIVGAPFLAGPGGVELRRIRVAGTVGDEVSLDALEGELGLSGSSLPVEFSEGIAEARFDRGTLSFRRCGDDCPFGDRGWFEIVAGGGATAAGGRGAPADALRLSAGPRGRGFVWGRAYIDPMFERSAGVNLRVLLDGLPYRSFDNTGRPEFEVEVSTTDLELTGGTPLVLTGVAEVDRSRYVKDAVQGVEILAFTDGSPSIEAAPPDLLQGMTFDVRVETDRPFRIENNVASGLLADAVVDLTGTYEDPEFTGRLDIEPGGTVDIPFLTGTYEIQRGRVTLLRELEDAEVDVLATRNEPIYIDDQPRTVQLQLGGTLSAIRWSCLTDAGGGGELDTVRGCTEYLVLGAGDVQLSENDVQQFGAGGLAGVRKPLQVVGHLTEFDVGERAAEAAPRLGPYIPDVRLRLGQIGPELEIATPTEWLDFDYGRATFGWDYTRGYPGFLLRQSREATLKLEILDPITIQYSRRTRSYLNERVIFDPLEQRALELRFDFNIPSLR